MHKTLPSHNFLSPFSLPLDSNSPITGKLSDWVMVQLNEFLGHDHEQRLHFQRGSHSQGPYHIINGFRILGKVWKKIDLGTSLILLSFTIILPPELYLHGDEVMEDGALRPLKDLLVVSESGADFQLTWVKCEGLIRGIYSAS